MAFIIRARVETLRDLGMCQHPFGSFCLLQGLETLSLRANRHCQNANAIASWLKSRPEVTWVSHPSLTDNPYHAQANRYFRKGTYGSVLCFGVKGGSACASKLIDNLKMISHLANVGDAKTLIICPAVTTHQQLTDSEQAAAGVKPDMCRLSVGIEHLNDIKSDLENALVASQQ